MVVAAEWEAIFAPIGFWIVAFQSRHFKDDLILQIVDVQGKLLAMFVDLYWDGHMLLVDFSESVAIDSGEVVRSYCQSGFSHMHPSPHSGSLRLSLSQRTCCNWTKECFIFHSSTRGPKERVLWSVCQQPW